MKSEFKVGDRVIAHGQPGVISDIVQGLYRIPFDTPAPAPALLSNYWGEWKLRLESKAFK